MIPPESRGPDPLGGELTETPPSDLSDYTWDESETERFEPGEQVQENKETRRFNEDLGGFVNTLTTFGLVGESEIRALSSRLSADGQTGTVDRLASELIRLGKLTKYQAAAIRQGKTRGLVIGNYVVLDKIGSGGMGLVLKARHRQLQRIVALKLLPPSFSRDRAAVARFRREAAAVAKLRHANIVAALDAGETHGLLFLVMEFVDGKDLARIVKEKGPLSVARAVDCIIQAARGLKEAHDHGIVHRDIKPANLLLDRSGIVKVLDLGLARVSLAEDPVTSESSELNLTVSGAIVGTVDYMSPEQAYNPRQADGRSDVYSLGCTLHFLLTGKAPYGGKSFMERLLGHRERPIPSLAKARGDVSDDLDFAFQRMMSKSPDRRPASMSAVVNELDACRATATGKPKGKSRFASGPGEESDDPESIYEFAGSTNEITTRRFEPVTSVFVRSRAPSSDRIEGPRLLRARRRRQLLAGFLVIVVGSILGWLFLTRAARRGGGLP
jgi:serine/threonine protein kinase